MQQYTPNRKKYSFLFKARTLPWALSFCKATKSMSSKEISYAVEWNGNIIMANGGPPFQHTLEEPLYTTTTKEDAEKIYTELDGVYAKQWSDSTYQTHGVVIPEDALRGPHSYSKCVKGFVTSLIGFDYEPGYYLSAKKRQFIPKYSNINVIVEKNEYIPLAKSFMDGLSKEANILSLQDASLSEYDTAMLLANHSFDLFIASASSIYNLVMKATYKGIDYPSENPTVISVIETAMPDDPRSTVLFGSQILIENNSTAIDNLKSYGSIWKIRSDHNHDHLLFLKKRYESMVDNNKRQKVNAL